MKGHMLGSRSLEGDLSLAHSVHATSLQSDVSGGSCGAHLMMLLAQPAQVAQPLGSG